MNQIPNPAQASTIPNPVVALIDYGASNLRSVEKALQGAGATVKRVGSGDALGTSDLIVVPGQGHFGRAMEELRRRGFESVLRREVLEGRTPYLGICIGYQILFEESEEAPGVKGLGWIEGKVVKFRGNIKIPHMGWNEIEPVKSEAGWPGGASKDDGADFFYFVHSFYPVPKDAGLIAAACDYGGRFACAIRSKNIFAVQFHPEKSQKAGQQFLQGLLSLSHPWT